MPEAEHVPAREWSTPRRYEAAIRACIDDDLPVATSARRYGVDRSHLSTRVRDTRAERDARVERARENLAKDRLERGIDEEFMSFRQFWDRYFSGVVCQDCGVHHDFPDFHQEMIDAIEDPANRRVLINLPPFHSKTTLVSIWHTIYDLCRNPNHRTIIISKSQDFAKTILYAIKNYLTNHELYANTEGNLIDDFGPFHASGSPGLWSQTEITIDGRTSTEKDPTVVVLGVQGQVYGRRADRVKFDDYATVENSATPDRVTGILGWTDKEALSRIGKNGQAVWVGTRVTAHDPYGVLNQRRGYVVIRKSCIVDEHEEKTLWPEHFPFDQALVHREEMTTGDWQLVFQNVDHLGAQATFTPDIMDAVKDPERVLGHFDPMWRLVGGVDPAGGTKGSGFTALCVVGIDLVTGKRYLVDLVMKKSMPSWQMKDQMLEWADRYPIVEWRCEASGVQSQLFQYNRELVKELALRGQTIKPHNTGSNKWDPQFGVESLGPLFAADLWSIPWGSPSTQAYVNPLIEQFLQFPLSAIFDGVMCCWFADLGCRSYFERNHLPMFDSRATKRWPNRIKRRRRIVNFSDRTVRKVPVMDQRPGHLSPGQMDHRRMTVGRLNTPHRDVAEHTPHRVQMVNVDQSIDVDGVVYDSDGHPLGVGEPHGQDRHPEEES